LKLGFSSYKKIKNRVAPYTGAWIETIFNLKGLTKV